MARGKLDNLRNLGRFYRLATELAFNKRRLTHFPAEEDTRARVVELRRQVGEMTDDQNVERKT